MRCLILTYVATLASGLSSSSTSEQVQLARSRLHDSLKSLSGKLTLSPEIEIPEPKDPTAVLLQSTAITQLSSLIRTKAKANAAFVSGSFTAVQMFCNEQELSRGEFPGPIPVVYCCGKDEEINWTELAETGVCGVLIPCSMDDLLALPAKCADAIQVGLQPLPEVVLLESEASTWMQEDSMLDFVSRLTDSMGFEPASIIVTIQSSNDDEQERVALPLPPVSKDLRKRLPILGSISVSAGGGRMGGETKRFKDAGYTGAVLRAGCLPPVFTEDLLMVSRFWSSCIGDLKSTKSKNFEFRTRNYLESSASLDWAKYQKSVIESGALGSEEHSSINSDGGDYQGF